MRDAELPPPTASERGFAYPADATTEALRARFDLAVAVAEQLLGEDATRGELWAMSRALFRSAVPTDDQPMGLG